MASAVRQLAPAMSMVPRVSKNVAHVLQPAVWVAYDTHVSGSLCFLSILDGATERFFT